ncbi:MAG TPA: TIGR03790 family protein, partial [Verrucomicrobiota bacterium]|nr:TIGR03790 family protein [Verrucomicrobiota bacterium]
EEHDPQRTLRCLVTVWGVPLKIGPAKMDDERTKYRNFLEGDRRQRLNALKEVGRQLDLLAAHIVVAQPDPPGGATPPAVGENELAAAQVELERRLQHAQARVARLEGDELAAAAGALQQLATLAGGARVLLQGLEGRLAVEPGNAELRSQYDTLRGRAGGLFEMQVLLDQVPLGYYHDALVLAAVERTSGLLGAIQWLDEQLKIVAQNETGASFDSELSLVMWPDDYELLRWQPNYLRAGYDASQWPQVFRTLMVARLDGPTLALAKGLVDAAIETEQEGLDGKAYFDARGMGRLDQPNVKPGSYEDYDRAVLITARGMQEQTTLDVVLNDGPELFQAGECPDAALYCGWYSLAKYVDAFTWVRGAVGYHMASSEATTLRDPGSQAWCKRMIENGVAATMGPVYEPYLMAFPRPNEFFGLLLQGQLSLVECYYRTLPYNSWMMTLIGDPLYRPFKNRSVLRTGEAAAAETTPAAEPTAAAAP